jgi:hypothetical protein
VQKREYPHNTPEQVRDYLLEALTIVAEIDPPDDLRGLAFSKAVDLVSAKQVIFEQMPAIPNLLPQ